MTKNRLKTRGLIITVTAPPVYSQLASLLVDLGYRRVQMVISRGEFSMRGSVVDIFPSRHSHPIRMEYDGENGLDRFFSFSVQLQRSLSPLDKVKILPVVSGDVEAESDASQVVMDNLLSSIKLDDYVVHERYGVGRYQGLVRKTFGEYEGEFLYVSYAGDDKLFVPLDQLHLLHRYSAGDVTPTLNGLSDGQWKKTTAKVRRELQVLAQDLVLLYQQRAVTPGFVCREDTVAQLDFEQAFAYTPTKDQLRACAEIKQDMESPFPMDRVLCGDVGFGKTEVVVRAAFKMCENLKQICVLCPTTLLAHQHAKVFLDRFKETPYKIAVLSRFKTKAQQRDILRDLKAQRVDIVIGTHRLLQEDVKFLDLGLLVIDEEQRFGVDQKERFKKQFVGVDILSVSATPIPRTLYMSLTGARDFSAITTPPVQKRPVLTHVLPFSEARVTAAIEAEIARQGQIFYVYNQVQYMPTKVAQLQQMMPHVRFGFAHGQLDETTLEETILEFWKGQYDVLICSTIIENGIDMPNVNTIIIEQADHFGLSQIHQLRGRVGRGRHQGVAYLMYNDVNGLSEVGQQRLDAIKSYVALGSGYKLAMKDLELRGAGSLLGQRQHGHMTSIGFELYCKLLSEVVDGQKPNRRPDPLLLLAHLPKDKAFIPEDYIEDERERLAVYQRLASMTDMDELDDLKFDLEDRYGELPDQLCHVFKLAWL